MTTRPTVEILFEDNHCLAVNKPAGLLTQGDATGEPTLLDWARASLKARFQKPGNVFVGLVHRLDRPTSGVVLLARTSKAAARLSAQFREGKVEKVYRAIVEGTCPQESGTWTDTLRKDEARNVVEVVAEGMKGGRDAALRLPGARAPGRVDAARAPSGHGEGPSAPGPARVEGTTDRGRPEVRRLDHADGARRETPDRAACPPVDVHSPDAPGSDFGRCAGAGRLALARSLMGKPDRPQ